MPIFLVSDERLPASHPEETIFHFVLLFDI